MIGDKDGMGRDGQSTFFSREQGKQAFTLVAYCMYRHSSSSRHFLTREGLLRQVPRSKKGRGATQHTQEARSKHPSIGNGKRDGLGLWVLLERGAAGRGRGPWDWPVELLGSFVLLFAALSDEQGPGHHGPSLGQCVEPSTIPGTKGI